MVIFGGDSGLPTTFKRKRESSVISIQEGETLPTVSFDSTDTVFMVIDIPFEYNVIIGRPILYDTEATICIRYLTMKISTSKGIITIWGDQGAAKECYTAGTKEG
ncbi:conserved hypothetical protein [Ricinus communis]|uniref:Uncharacterized protein n=1 Tax=Ricinus communis TaxID=3988 RepID=B9S0F0_RICCO|nr:conserved hypothetical protein [Ricinus communis]